MFLPAALLKPMKQGVLIENLLKALGLVLLSALLGLSVNSVRRDSLPLVQDWDKARAAAIEQKAAGALTIISPEEAGELFGKNGVLFLDARSRDFFEFERIPKAGSLPLEEADSLLPELLKEIPGGTRIITYCDGETCPSALELAGKIRAAGHGNVAVFLGGISDWVSRGMPTESGEGG